MAMESKDGAGDGQPKKFSRYRSVRKAAKNSQNLHDSPPLPVRPVTKPTEPSGNGVSASIPKSMSRYRRKKASDSTSPVSPLQNPLPGSVDATLAQGATRNFEAAISGSSRVQKHESKGKRLYAGDYEAVSTEEDEAARERHRRDAMDRLTGGSQSVQSKPVSRRPTRREKTTRQFIDDRVHVDVPQRQTLSREPSEGHASRRSSNEPKRVSLKEMLNMRSNGAQNQEPPRPVETGGQFIGMDAPVSAVNAGERRVLVHYKKSSINTCITPSTTVHDLLLSVSTCLSGINPQKFVVMEFFSQLSMQRPLRKYEYVRDVMNSWINDDENYLIIVPPSSFDSLNQLEANSAPSEQPANATFHIYYSNRPRKWDKRFITLRADGQVTMSKKQGQDSTNICHLSDFDIYSPTSSYLNNMKPPKKTCYAVKSQQKSSMFLSTENYVHFFCSNDRVVAEGWYRAVQTWRSWYLATKIGVRVDKETDGVSNDSKSYQPGSFKPLIDLETLEISNNGDSQAKPSKTQELFERKKSVRGCAGPPSTFPKSLSLNTDPACLAQENDETFAPAGLLGRTYTMRQRAMREREEEETRAHEAAFTHGLVGMSSRRPSGPSSQPTSRSNTMTSAQPPDMSNLARCSHSANKHQPLVDLTPTYKEAPQHTRKNRGQGVTVEPGVPLIDAATGPDLAPASMAIPPSTTWRRPSNPEVPARSRQRSNTARSVNPSSRQYHTAPASPADLPSPENPFMPNSLLSRSNNPAVVQGHPVGHGVATGDRNATKPMLDLSPENPFAEGSLLRNL